MSEIQISNETVLFDEEDRHIIEKYCWHISYSRPNYPVISSIEYVGEKDADTGRRKYSGIVLSRKVVNATKDQMIRFKNKNYLDVRKENLSVVDRFKVVGLPPENWVLDRESIIWAAGLFDGEGCFSNSANGPVAMVNMTDLDSVQKFCDAVGMGSIRETKVQKEHYKPLFTWRVFGFENYQALLVMLHPWLNKRRQDRGCEVLEKYNKPKIKKISNNICLIQDCGKMVSGRGLCKKHHARWKNQGGKNGDLKKTFPNEILLGPIPDRKRMQYKLGLN